MERQVTEGDAERSRGAQEFSLPLTVVNVIANNLMELELWNYEYGF